MLRRSHIERISRSITMSIAEEHALLSGESTVHARIENLLTKNMEEERAIEDEAHKLLDRNRKAMGGDVDEQKAFFLIKKQLAKQKNFIL